MGQGQCGLGAIASSSSSTVYSSCHTARVASSSRAAAPQSTVCLSTYISCCSSCALSRDTLAPRHRQRHHMELRGLRVPLALLALTTGLRRRESVHDVIITHSVASVCRSTCTSCCCSSCEQNTRVALHPRKLLVRLAALLAPPEPSRSVALWLPSPFANSAIASPCSCSSFCLASPSRTSPSPS